MVGSFAGVGVRQLRSRPLRTLLTGVGVMLGVGMVFGVLLLSGTIRNTFDDIVSSIWGTKDLVVTSRGGQLPDRDVQLVRSTPGVRDASPMLGAIVIHLDAQGRAIHGMGGHVNLAGFDPDGPPPYDFEWVSGRKPRGTDDVVLERNWANDQHIRVGDDVRVGSPHGPRRLHVVGLFALSGGLDFGATGYAFMATAPARALLDQPHGWLQIAVRAKDRSRADALRATLQKRLGRGAKVDTPAGWGSQIKEQLKTLDVVLYFFAGVALFVGGFLILNSFSMTVSQRIREIGMLRTLGATRRMIRRSVLIEAGLLGTAGSALGLAAGLGLAALLIAFIRGVGVPVGTVHVTWSSIVIAAILGLVATTIGAWWPARRAARIPPVRAARDGVARQARTPWWRPALGLALYVPGAIWGGRFWFGNGSGDSASAALGVAMTMAMFLGMALAAPVIINPLVRLLSVPLRRLAPTGGRLASDAARRNPARTAATAVALTIGLSVVVVNSAMASSFMHSIRSVIDTTFADALIVRPVGAQFAEGGARTIGSDVQKAIAALPDVRAVSPMSVTVAELPGMPSSQPYGVIEGYDPRTMAGAATLRATGIAQADIPAALARGEALLGREYSQAHHKDVGDTIALPGPRATARVRIAGIYDEFTDFGGNVVAVSNATVARLYGSAKPSRLIVAPTGKERLDAMTRSVDALLTRRYPQLEALTTKDLEADISGQINQQFALFNGIVAIAVIVSLLGVINTLAMSVMERTREIGVLRALGSTRRLVRMTMVHEGVLMTTAGALAGLGLGAVIAWFWVMSIEPLLHNIAFSIPLSLILGVAVASLVLGAIAAVLPARRAARLDVVDALSYE